MDVNTGGTDINDGTTFTSASYAVGFTVTLRTRATTGTYYSVPAMSEEFTVRGETYHEYNYYLTCLNFPFVIF